MPKTGLYIAFACHPDLGSEAGRGWEWLKFLGETHNITLITSLQGGNKKRIEEEVQQNSNLKKNINLHFLPSPIPKNQLFQITQEYYKPLYYHYYRKWLGNALSHCHTLIKQNPQKYGLVHHCNYAAFRDPAPFWTLGLPSIWGPICGFHNIPTPFLSSLSPTEALRHTFRNLLNTLHLQCNKKTKDALQNYSHLLFQSKNHIPFKIPTEKMMVIPGQMTTKRLRSLQSPPKEKNQNLKLCFAAQHISRKGGHLLIEAFANAIKKSSRSLELHMIGHGPLTQHWKTLSQKLACDPYIHWHGEQTRTKTLEIMKTSHVFIFLSLCDTYPTVIAEALAMSLPIITTNLPGIGEMISPKCGYILPATCPKTVIQSATNAILHLAENPDKLQNLKLGTQTQARELDFEHHMQQLHTVYKKYLS